MKLLRMSLFVALSAGLVVSLLYVITISRGYFSGDSISPKDRMALKTLHKKFQTCVKANGFGLQAIFKDHCRVSMKFPSSTVPKWKDPKSGQLEGLAYDFNLCETLTLWEQIRNISTVLTREYIDALPNGWQDYAWKRINKGIFLNKCENKSLCEEKLSQVLPQTPPFSPRQYGKCAIVGNSGDLLQMHVGEEIDQYDAVVRNNGAPVENYTQYVGKKTTFRLLNRGSAKALDKVAALDGSGKEVLIIKTTIHDAMSRMIKEVPIKKPVSLMLGMPLGPSAKGTGLKAIEFALSLCETVDIYGFTVDPGYTEWTRYFSESRGGHTPLQGRAYYQMMECLGLITIHSPMRDANGQMATDVPERTILEAARIAAEHMQGKLLRNGDPLSHCAIWSKRESKAWKPILKRKAAKQHYMFVNGVTQYPLEESSSKELLCIKPTEAVGY